MSTRPFVPRKSLWARWHAANAAERDARGGCCRDGDFQADAEDYRRPGLLPRRSIHGQTPAKYGRTRLTKYGQTPAKYGQTQPAKYGQTPAKHGQTWVATTRWPRLAAPIADRTRSGPGGGATRARRAGEPSRRIGRVKRCVLWTRAELRAVVGTVRDTAQVTAAQNRPGRKGSVG